MARKITMFELHFDGAHFGPALGESPEETDETEFDSGDEYDEEAASGSPIRPALAAVGAIAVVSAAGFLAARRFRGGSDEEFGYEGRERESVGIGEVEESDEALVE